MRLTRWANRAVELCSTTTALLANVVLILAWFLLGPAMGYSDRWFLIVGTYSAVITTPMSFAILLSSRRGDGALHAKLDALIHYLDVPNDYEELDREDVEHIDSVREEIRVQP